MDIKKILYPIDFSETSLEAIDYAQYLTRISQAQLILFHVVEFVDYTSVFEIVQESEEEIIHKLYEKKEGQMKSILDRFKDCSVVGKLVHGHPLDEIIKIIGSENINLVIMPTHGNTGLLSSLMGGLADKVVKKAPCPVVIIKPKNFANLN